MRLRQVNGVYFSESYTEQSVSLTDSGGGKYTTETIEKNKAQNTILVSDSHIQHTKYDDPRTS